MNKEEGMTRNDNDFDGMLELIGSYCSESEDGNADALLRNLLRDVQEFYPSQFPKLMVFLEAHKSPDVFNMFPLANKVEILRDFPVSDDFHADVTRLLSLVIDRHALAAFTTSDDPCDRAAKKFVDRYGDGGTWADAMAILAEQ